MIYQHISSLIQQAIEAELIEQSDEIYTRNQVMCLLKLETFPEESGKSTEDTIPNLLEKLIDFAIEDDVIENVLDEKEILSASIMNCFVPRPSAVTKAFYEKYEQSPEAATNYFYNLSKNSNYIQMNRIQKNIQFKADTNYGALDITINLSKPEKDPEQIKREREQQQQLHYPKCLLCVENEGYAGRTGHPARANHRIIPVPLHGENWYLQYSPYVYYNEHSILLSEEHRDMKIVKQTFDQLLTFVEKFPHYFIGSNADLPIVGGSILTHEHFQAGHYEFAMTNAEESFEFSLEGFSNVSAAVLNWPLSVIRLNSPHMDELVETADHILQTWRKYTDPAADVQAFSGDTPHNTITPIARMRDGQYELDLVLRNNRTSDEHPLGIFHPHADVHHIKKENIGLIEVMGLAVLPARLKDELVEIEKYFLGQPANVADYHKDWAEQLKNEYGFVSQSSEAENILQRALGSKFIRVLEDAGVLKVQAAFERFIETLNQ
ncbi:UDP-glucose--hexose-1-phosphate uridylyltransferase [Virgibacillus profundi]|uniref:Galactose-1-phosphate uridylyltransferase n=1 Tax=Virgibacillus profundi TaxID=2024555 RepID=A0A2A2IIS5_9BACI|nr:UDP-glucose--hexose-1-phosphate uridylyltransferase [Virgibacillus profundi]PAV31164.1 UDP-glucose--hexose-1-phosphate uridylyltransferase [Virgibacillus profundi]PXY55347.1 UDP-glucose--hexose-1-phosphate uridylyltransferase [Virgibacillus profundi]